APSPRAKAMGWRPYVVITCCIVVSGRNRPPQKEHGGSKPPCWLFSAIKTHENAWFDYVSDSAGGCKRPAGHDRGRAEPPGSGATPPEGCSRDDRPEFQANDTLRGASRTVGFTSGNSTATACLP